MICSHVGNVIEVRCRRKWVYSPKISALPFSALKYLSFRGGDFAPPFPLCCYWHTALNLVIAGEEVWAALTVAWVFASAH
jgi:hypothetical protein